MKRQVFDLVFSVTMALGCGLTAGADTIYVDCNLKSYDGHDGSSWEKAYKTIQDGVDAAKPDDTVLVAPGWYDEGGATLGDGDLNLTNRVCITKRLTVRSKEGRSTRDRTFIVGRHATVPEDPNALGMGQDAVRCVRFDYSDAVHGAVLEGFTLVNGATRYNSNAYSLGSIGGGACFGKVSKTETTASYLVDCVVSNCVATRGGGIYFGNAVRCRFTANAVSEDASAVRDSNLYWCIVDANRGVKSTGKSVNTSVLLGGTKAVNCSIVNNDGITPLKGNSDAARCFAANSVVLAYAAPSSLTYLALTNCVMPLSINLYANGGNPKQYLTDQITRVEVSSHQFVSTAGCDLRPLATGVLSGKGDVRLLEHIPSAYRYTDYNGQIVSPDGPVAAGACQKIVTPSGGCIVYKGFSYRDANLPGLRIDGYQAYGTNLYSYATSFPDAHLVECQMPQYASNPEAHWLYAFVGKTSSTTYYCFPLRGTLISSLIAPALGDTLTVTAKITDNALWTDPNVEDGEPMDGTEAHPYNTLQAAADAAGKKTGYWMIFAKKGRYDRGGKAWKGLNNRVALTAGSTYFRLYAVDGPGETVIAGCGDESSAHPYKYGSNAVRCVGASSGASSVNGFTLADGRCTLNNGSEETGADGLYGGGVYGGSAAFQVEDCIITNCAASRGAIAWKTTLRRCRIVDCTSTKLGALRGGCHASACVFDRIRTAVADNETDYIVGQDEFVYNCTFRNDPSNPMRPFGNVEAFAFNSIVTHFGYSAYVPKMTIAGCFYDSIVTVETSARKSSGCAPATIAYTDDSTGDYSLRSACLPTNGGRMEEALLGDGYRIYGSAVDCEGHPFAFGAGGTVTAGAYQRTSPSVCVTVMTPDGVVGGVSPLGDQILTPEASSVTVTATDARTRNFGGFYLDGERVSTEASYDFHYSEDDSDGVRHTLEARYVPHWYVDASAPDDSASGCDWAHPKRTLAAALGLALPGDTVHAAPGVYAEGDMLQHTRMYTGATSEVSLRARAVVTNGVTLVSRDGAESTVIAGRSSAENIDGFGGGSDALRCVVLYPDAQLVGFTLTGGRSSGETELNDNTRGVGVHGWSDLSPIMRDCIVSNCVAARAAGAVYVKAVNCRFFENRALNNASVGHHAEFHNCYFDRNHGSSVIGFWRELRNCTIGHDNDCTHALDSSDASKFQNPALYNTLILSGDMVSSASLAFTNCVFSTDMLAHWSPNATTNETCRCATSDQLADIDGCPVIGGNVAIDAGDTNYLDRTLCGDCDIDGRPRCINGLKMDVGCFEADWKVRYAKDLSARRVTVTDADPGVCETDERAVRLTDGTTLSMEVINTTGRSLRQRVIFRVVGEGFLSLIVDGKEHREYVSAADVQKYEFDSADENRRLEFSFVGSGSAELLAYKRDSGVMLMVR